MPIIGGEALLKSYGKWINLSLGLILTIICSEIWVRLNEKTVPMMCNPKLSHSLSLEMVMTVGKDRISAIAIDEEIKNRIDSEMRSMGCESVTLYLSIDECISEFRK